MRKKLWICLALFLVIPALFVVMFVLVYPVVQTVFLSMTETGLTGGSSWVGFKNFQRALMTPRFWVSVENTLLFTAVTVPIELILGLGLAVMLNKAFHGRGIVRLAVLFAVGMGAGAAANTCADRLAGRGRPGGSRLRPILLTLLGGTGTAALYWWEIGCQGLLPRVRFPVTIAVRTGMVGSPSGYALSNSTASCANASRFGEVGRGWP